MPVFFNDMRAADTFSWRGNVRSYHRGLFAFAPHCTMSSPPSGGSSQPLPAPAARTLPEDWLTAAAMALLALITFANVLVRYFTDASFAWTEEISVFLMIVLALVGGASAVARDAHIRIEFFYASGSVARRRRLAQLGAALVALLFTVIAVLSVRVVWDDYRFEETSPGIGVPQWWYSIWLPVCAIAIALRAVGLWRQRTRQSDADYLNASEAAAIADAQEPRP